MVDPLPLLSFSTLRFWHHSPQPHFLDIPHRKFIWKEQKLPPNYKRPNCTFGQYLKPLTTCSRKHQELWNLLDELGIIYFARSGSELGIIRGGSFLSSDGDMDVFVDVPQSQFTKLVRDKISPRIYGDGGYVSAENHWKVPGCPMVNMVFNDWMVDQMVHDYPRPTFDNLCTCYLDSAKLACHKDAKARMYVHYGPSWFVPLKAKYGDMPWIARGTTIQKKLAQMVSSDGIIYEEAVRKLDPSVQYTKYAKVISISYFVY